MSETIPSGKTQRFLVFLTSVSFFVIGVLFSGWAIYYLAQLPEEDYGISQNFKSSILIIGVVWIFVSGLIFIFRKKIQAGFLLALSSINLSYLFGELAVYLLVISGFTDSRVLNNDASFGAFNKPCAVFDTVSGYRWLNAPCRQTKIVKGEIVFDQIFQANNRGYVSQRDFEFQKDSSTFRYIVFGDSYTAAEFNPTSWTDQVQGILDKNFNRNMELYSFAVNGGGLFNWHRIFFHEVIPGYDFDGIIMAVYGNDFDRNFAMMHHTEQDAHFSYFESAPRSEQDFYENYLPKMPATTEIVADSILENRIRQTKEFREKTFHLESPDLNLLMKAYDGFNRVDYEWRKEKYKQKFMKERQNRLADYSASEFTSRYGKEKFMMLDSILSYCSQNEKKVILCVLPDEGAIQYVKGGKYHWMQAEVEGLSKLYDADYFDGIEIFKSLPDEEIKGMYLKHDTHWNEKGSGFFAEKLAERLSEIH